MHKVGDAVAAAIEIRVDAKVAQICIGIFSSSRYMQYLPGLYAEDDLMGRLLIVAENQLQPCEEHIANLDLYFDPHLTTDEKLRWLAATWLGVRWDERWNERSVEVQRRRLIAKMFDLYRSRGTKRGLQWMLYLALPLDWDEKPDVDVADEEVNELSERFGSMEPGQLKALKKLDKRIRITEYVAEDMELGGKAVLGPGIALGIGNVPYSFDVRVKVPPGEEAKWQDLEPELKRIVASEKPAHTVCRRLEMVEMANV
jgi:phage tail-like protein